jgi:shikimate dehydrogenase
MKFKAAVLGSPIKHSLSPLIHNHAYKVLGFDGNYEAIEVKQIELRSFLSPERLSNPDWCGFSLTMPLKEEICSKDYMDLIEVDTRAARIRSANTIFRNGTDWKATSTDVTGIEFLLNDRKFHKVAILGAGGTARAALTSRHLENSEILIYRRNASRDSLIIEAFPEHRVQFLAWDEINQGDAVDLLINTVPDDGVSSVYLDSQAVPILLDAIYSPWLPTLSRRQLEGGGQLISGIDLLCAQAIFQIEAMTQRVFDKTNLFGELKKVALQSLQ